MESPSATEPLIQPFCVWEQDSRDLAIQIPAEVIRSLGTESLVAFKRVPRRGLETGGILLGRTEVQGNTTTFWIEGFEPVESEHRFGPSYLLSESDFAHLQTELTTKGTASIGIYRSQTRSEQLAIQDADTGLFEKCFGAGDGLFLMLAPLPRVGAFYFREDGNLKCVHEFPLVSSLSSIATQPRTSSPPASLEAPQSVGTHGVHASIAGRSADQADALADISQESDRETSRGLVLTTNRNPGTVPPKNSGAGSFLATYFLWMTAIRRWAVELWSDRKGRISGVKLGSWVLAAVALVVLTVNLLSYSSRRPATPVRAAPSYLYLTVERAGPALLLHWDGNSSAVRGATRAVLHIQDGDQQHDKELAPTEFLAGQYTYQPQNSAVTFRLNAYAGEPNAIGLVQVMLPPSPIAPAPSIEPVRPPAQYNYARTQPQVTPIARIEAHPAQSPPTLPSNDQKDHNAETQLPAVRLPEAPKTSPPAARDAPLSAGFDESQWHFPDAARNDISTSRRELTVRTYAAPIPIKGGGLLGKIPFLGRLRKQPRVVEAHPVYQPPPIVRLPRDQQLIGQVAVGVKVHVGESGAVEDAELVDYGDNLVSPTLVNAALEAARNWTFAPSRIDDIPVASQMIVRFYFSP